MIWAIVLAVFSTLVFAHWYRRPISARERLDDWTPGHVAWLAGGQARTRATWWAALRSGGHIEPVEVSRARAQSGRWRRTTKHPSGDDRFLRAAYAVIDPGMTREQIDRAWDTLFKSLKFDLTTANLLASDALIERRNFQAKAWLWVEFLLLVLSISFLSQVPFACLVFLTINLVVGVGILSTYSPPRLTTAGARRIQEWKRTYVAEQSAPTSDTLPLGIALGGSDVLSGTPFSRYADEDHDENDRRRRNSSDDAGVGLWLGASSCGTPTGPSHSASSDSPSNTGFTTGGGFGGDSHFSSGHSDSSSSSHSSSSDSSSSGSSGCSSSSSSSSDSSSSGCSSSGCGGGGGGD